MFFEVTSQSLHLVYPFIFLFHNKLHGLPILSVCTDLHSKAKTELQRAIQDVHEATCVKFQARKKETDYVSFQPAVDYQM